MDNLDKTNELEDVVFYLRTASDDEYQLEMQEIRLKKYCELKGYKVQKVYKDFKYSAKDMTRPQFLELQKDIKKGITKKVLVTSYSRISRDLIDLKKFLEVLLVYDCGYDSIDTFDMFSFLGNTQTSLFTFFGDLKDTQGGLLL